MPKNLYLYTIVAALDGLLFGFDTAVINGALPFFSNHFQLDEVMQDWAVSSSVVAADRIDTTDKPINNQRWYGSQTGTTFNRNYKT